MKRVLSFSLLMLLSFTAVVTSCHSSKPATNTVANAPAAKVADDKEIRWLTFDELQVQMNKKPRKVYIDVYTDWCGWCKVMDKKTFTNPEVIKYMNEKYYAVRFNPEKQDSIRFMGKMHTINADAKVNTLAMELMSNRMTYPTTVILDEGYMNPQPIPGYLEVPVIEKILKFFGDNHYRTTKYEDFDKNYTPTWASASKETEE